MNKFLTRILKLLIIVVFLPFWLFSEKDIENNYNKSNIENTDYSTSYIKKIEIFKKNQYLSLNNAYDIAIGFSIKNNSPFAKLVISELTGKDIFETTVGKIERGSHYYKWNRITNYGNEVDAGIYFLSIYEDGILISKKNIIIYSILS